MRVHPPAHPDGGHSCRGSSLGRGVCDCPHNTVLTVTSLTRADPARPYFLITFLAGRWELPRQAGGPGHCGAHRHMGHVVEGGGCVARGPACT